ncbi:Suf-domain-containing protein, partial [Aureobasidium melanogenum]
LSFDSSSSSSSLASGVGSRDSGGSDSIQCIQAVVVGLLDGIATADKAFLAIFDRHSLLNAVGTSKCEKTALWVGRGALGEEVIGFGLHIIVEAELGSVVPDLGPEAKSHGGLSVDVENTIAIGLDVLLFQNKRILLFPFDPVLPDSDLLLVLIVALAAGCRGQSRDSSALQVLGDLLKDIVGGTSGHVSWRLLLEELAALSGVSRMPPEECILVVACMGTVMARWARLDKVDVILPHVSRVFVVADQVERKVVRLSNSLASLACCVGHDIVATSDVVEIDAPKLDVVVLEESHVEDIL